MLLGCGVMCDVSRSNFRGKAMTSEAQEKQAHL